MMVVLEKEGLDGTAHPYTLGWREAGMRAAGRGSEHASVTSGTSREVGGIEYGEDVSCSLHRGWLYVVKLRIVGHGRYC